MNAILKQRELIERTASAPDKVQAFQDGINRLRVSHPDRWVVYTDRWDDETRTYTFFVHGVFETQKQAVDSTLYLTPKERGTRTLISTRVPKAGVRIGSATG